MECWKKWNSTHFLTQNGCFRVPFFFTRREKKKEKKLYQHLLCPICEQMLPLSVTLYDLMTYPCKKKCFYLNWSNTCTVCVVSQKTNHCCDKRVPKKALFLKMCVLTTIKYDRKVLNDWFPIHYGENFMNYILIVNNLVVQYVNWI